LIQSKVPAPNTALDRSMTADNAIFLVKALHTAVFLVASASILYALWSGLTGRIVWRPLHAAIAVPTIIGLLWWLNGRECLLSSIIYRLAGGDHTQSDIFLPDWMSSRIMPVSTAVLAVAIGLILWRRLTQRPQTQRTRR
jgi:hypothetical protein